MAFKIFVKTGDKPGAGTSSEVYLQLCGDDWESEQLVHLSSATEPGSLKRRSVWTRDTFRRNTIREFHVNVPAQGMPTRLVVYMDSKDADWLLEGVRVDLGDQSAVFPFNHFIYPGIEVGEQELLVVDSAQLPIPGDKPAPPKSSAADGVVEAMPLPACAAGVPLAALEERDDMVVQTPHEQSDDMSEHSARSSATVHPLPSASPRPSVAPSGGAPRSEKVGIVRRLMSCVHRGPARVVPDDTPAVWADQVAFEKHDAARRAQTRTEALRRTAAHKWVRHPMRHVCTRVRARVLTDVCAQARMRVLAKDLLDPLPTMGKTDADLRTFFNRMDSSGNGTLDKYQISEAMRAMGKSEREIHKVRLGESPVAEATRPCACLDACPYARLCARLHACLHTQVISAMSTELGFEGFIALARGDDRELELILQQQLELLPVGEPISEWILSADDDSLPGSASQPSDEQADEKCASSDLVQAIGEPTGSDPDLPGSAWQASHKDGKVPLDASGAPCASDAVEDFGESTHTDYAPGSAWQAIRPLATPRRGARPTHRPFIFPRPSYRPSIHPFVVSPAKADREARVSPSLAFAGAR